MKLMLQACCLTLAMAAVAGQAAQLLTPEQQLGRRLFFDTRLSSPPGQSCASCHAPENGFAEPDAGYPVSQGVHQDRFGARNAPSAAYAGFSPVFHFDDEEGIYIGGQFWDGRAQTLAEQALLPLTNPVEMNNKDIDEVVDKVREAPYAALFDRVYGPNALADEEHAEALIARAIAAYERSPEVSPFNARYDAYLAGEDTLSPEELRGLELFEAEDKGNCAACHPSRPDERGRPPLFTDFSYDNLGVPRRADNPYYRMPADFNAAGEGYVDEGLGGALHKPEEAGKFKVPTLRNIALTAPYMHNGVFDTLEEVVRFYNSRDVDDHWGPPEVAQNVNREELGDLGLNEQEIADIVAFMKTLTDRPRAPLATADPKGNR